MQAYLKPYVVRAGVIAGVIVAVFSLIRIIPVIGEALACVLAPVTFLVGLLALVGAGVLAVMWGRQQGALGTTQQSLIDGAVAGGISGLISGAVAWVVAVLTALVSSFSGSDAGSTIVVLVAAVVGGLIGIIVAIIIGAIIAGLAAVVYASLTQPKTSVT